MWRLFLARSFRLELFFLVGFVVNWRWTWALAYLVAIALRASVKSAALHYNDLRHLVTFQSLAGELRESRELTDIEVTQLIPAELLDVLRYGKTVELWKQWRGLEPDPNFRPLRIYIARSADGQPRGQFKSYIDTTGSTILILPDVPTLASHPTERFQFYHELGHVTGVGALVWTKYLSDRVILLLLLLCVLLMVPPSLWFLSLLLLFTTVNWLETSFGIEPELKADACALVILSDVDSIQAVLNDHLDTVCVQAAARRGWRSRVLHGARIWQMQRAVFLASRVSLGNVLSSGTLDGPGIFAPTILSGIFVITTAILASSPPFSLIVLLIGVLVSVKLIDDLFLSILLRLTPVSHVSG